MTKQIIRGRHPVAEQIRENIIECAINGNLDSYLEYLKSIGTYGYGTSFVNRILRKKGIKKRYNYSNIVDLSESEKFLLSKNLKEKIYKPQERKRALVLLNSNKNNPYRKNDRVLGEEIGLSFIAIKKIRQRFSKIRLRVIYDLPRPGPTKKINHTLFNQIMSLKSKCKAKAEYARYKEITTHLYNDYKVRACYNTIANTVKKFKGNIF